MKVTKRRRRKIERKKISRKLTLTEWRERGSLEIGEQLNTQRTEAQQEKNKE